MPGCCAIGCKNRSEQGYRLFLIPQGSRNEARRSQWILNIGRRDLTMKAVVCEAHFTVDQFENNRQDNKRLLKWSAVPTIFNHHKSSDLRSKKKVNVRTVKRKVRSSPRKPVKLKLSDDYVYDYEDNDNDDDDDVNALVSKRSNCVFSSICDNSEKLVIRNSGNDTGQDVELDKISDFDKLCWVCGKLKNDMVSVFKHEEIALLINKYLPIEVNENDTCKSLVICKLCIQHLTDWDHLFKKCKKIEDFRCSKMLSTNHELLTEDSSLVEINKKNSVSEKFYENGTNSANILFKNSDCEVIVKDTSLADGLIDHDYNRQDFQILIRIRIDKKFVEHSSEEPSYESLINQLVELLRNFYDGRNNSQPEIDSFKSNTVINNDLPVNETEANQIYEQSFEDNSMNDNGGNKTLSPITVSDEINNCESSEETSDTSDQVIAEERHYLCSDCGHLSKKRKTFEQHRRLHHVEKKCEVCGIVFVSVTSYNHHVRKLHMDHIAKFSCDICGSKYIKNERLQRHKLVIHNIGKYFYCDVCNKKCASKQQLYCHKSNKHNYEINRCPICDVCFSSRISFSSHIRTKHLEGKIYSCSICKKNFTTRFSLISHTARLHPSDPSVNKGFCTDNINRLLLNDTLFGKELFSCLVCGLRIESLDMFKLHMNNHSDDMKNKIELCGLNDGNYMCYICDKYFNKENDLALHRFYSHHQTPHLCRIAYCNSSFWKKSSLIFHQILVHKDQSSTKS